MARSRSTRGCRAGSSSRRATCGSAPPATRPSVHIGAYAPIVKQISAVVNYKRGAQLGMPRDNALLVSTGELTPSAVIGAAQEGRRPAAPRCRRSPWSSTSTCGRPPSSPARSVSDAVGTFTYTPHAGRHA